MGPKVPARVSPPLVAEAASRRGGESYRSSQPPWGQAQSVLNPGHCVLRTNLLGASGNTSSLTKSDTPQKQPLLFAGCCLFCMSLELLLSSRICRSHGYRELGRGEDGEEPSSAEPGGTGVFTLESPCI